MLEHATYIYNVLIFLVSAILVVLLFKKLRISPVLGYLVAGLLIGPHTFGIIENVHEIKFLGEMGIIFLLFTIGLELPLNRLRSLGRYVFGLGLAQVLITGLVTVGVCVLLGFRLEQSILMGGALALSSTAVVLKVLTERGEVAAKFGRIAFSVLLFQDLAVVVLLILLPLITTGQGSFFLLIGEVISKTIIVLVTIGLAGRAVRPVFRLVAASDSPELFTAMTLLVILLTAVVTAMAGLSMELGAFLAGILLAETEYRHQVEGDIEPFRGLLLGLFFITVGMSIDLSLLMIRTWEIIGLVTGMVLGKALIILLLTRFFDIPIGAGIRIALLLAGGGEFAFIILTPAVETGFLTSVAGQVLYVGVAVSMALTPLMGMLGKLLEEQLKRGFGINLKAATVETQDLKGHVIIGGFGQTGQIISRILTQKVIPYVVLDMNMARVAEGRSKGLPVFYGDIRRLEVLRAVGAARAQAVVLTVDQPGASVRTISLLKRHFPKVHVCASVKDIEQGKKLEKVGATVVVPETIEPGLQLAFPVLQIAGITYDEAKQIMESFRKEYSQQIEALGNRPVESLGTP